MHRIRCKICGEATISSVTAAEDLGLCLHGFFLHASRAEGHLDLPLLASGGVNIFPAAGDFESGNNTQLLVTATFCWSCATQQDRSLGVFTYLLKWASPKVQAGLKECCPASLHCWGPTQPAPVTSSHIPSPFVQALTAIIIPRDG